MCVLSFAHPHVVCLFRNVHGCPVVTILGTLVRVALLSLCLQLAPAYEGVELGIGDSLLMKALQGASGRTMQQVRSTAASST